MACGCSLPRPVLNDHYRDGFVQGSQPWGKFGASTDLLTTTSVLRFSDGVIPKLHKYRVFGRCES